MSEAITHLKVPIEREERDVTPHDYETPHSCAKDLVVKTPYQQRTTSRI